MKFITSALAWLANQSGTIALYAGATMFLAQAFFLTYITFAWGIDRQRFYNVLAVAQGIDIAQSERRLRESVAGRIAQIQYDDVLNRRAERIRQDEFFGGNIDLASQQIGVHEQLIDAKFKTLTDRIAAFEKKLADTEKKARDAGLQEEIAIIDGLRPEAAKETLLSILRDDRDIDRAVLIVKGMDISKRAKMLGTITTDDEKKDMVTLLQLIGDGAPITPVVRQTQAQMDADKQQ